MPVSSRPHVLGVDDGPFEKGRDAETPLVGVFMEGRDLVEGVAVTRFPVDGEGVTDFLADWIGGLRFRPALQAVVLGGVTMAGLAVVEVPALAASLGCPVLVVNRRAPVNHRVEAALRSAGLVHRSEALRRAPESHALGEGLHVAAAGAEPERAAALVRDLRRKGELPEALRVAHLVAAALARGSSRGRA